MGAPTPPGAGVGAPIGLPQYGLMELMLRSHVETESLLRYRPGGGMLCEVVDAVAVSWSPVRESSRMAMKVREVIRLIEKDGWYLAATRGSHRQYKHPSKPGRVTIAGHPAHDFTLGTLSSIFKQAIGLAMERSWML